MVPPKDATQWCQGREAQEGEGGHLGNGDGDGDLQGGQGDPGKVRGWTSGQQTLDGNTFL